MATAILCRNPLYLQIKQLMFEDIRRGVWKAGEKLPTEPVLAERFGVSVGTIRRAMGSLEDEGIINRRVGAGTYVRTYKDTGNWNQFHIFTDINGKPRGTRKELVSISTVVPPDFVAEGLNIPLKTPVILMVRQLFDAVNGVEQLITVDESYLLADRFEGLTEARFKANFRPDDTLYKFYDREFGHVIIRQKCKVWFERVRPDTARRLRMPAHLEVLRTDRL
ncbi:transcriptional regulator, GntR family, partial [gut metagenome]